MLMKQNDASICIIIIINFFFLSSLPFDTELENMSIKIQETWHIVQSSWNYASMD